MDPHSPFASYGKPPIPVQQTRIVHVNFCNMCHHMWKAPVAARQCINCTNPNTAISLIHYETEVPIT